MPRLLALSGLLLAVVTVGLFGSPPSPAEATHYEVLFYLRPAGASSSSLTQEMNCGWHGNCDDGSWPDADNKGVDWDDLYGNTTEWRYTAYLYDNTATYTVAVGAWSTSSIVNPCPGVRVLMTNNYGTMSAQENWHTEINQQQNGSIYARRLGVHASYIIGTVMAYDPICDSTGPHTHQHRVSGAAGTAFGMHKNPDIPDEPNYDTPFPTLEHVWSWRWKH